jgi:hypothetical protein
VQFVPFTDILIPDDADDWETAPVIRKVRPTYAELVKDAQEKVGFIQKNIGPWLCDQTGGYDLGNDEQSPSQMLDHIKVHAKKTEPCYEAYVTYIPRDDDEEDEKELTDFTEQRKIAPMSACDSPWYSAKISAVRWSAGKVCTAAAICSPSSRFSTSPLTDAAEGNKESGASSSVGWR